MEGERSLENEMALHAFSIFFSHIFRIPPGNGSYIVIIIFLGHFRPSPHAVHFLLSKLFRPFYGIEGCVGHVNREAFPEFFRNPSIKIAIYLSDGIWNAYFPSEALQFIELFIWVADSPPIEIDDAYSSTIHID